MLGGALSRSSFPLAALGFERLSEHPSIALSTLVRMKIPFRRFDRGCWGVGRAVIIGRSRSRSCVVERIELGVGSVWRQHSNVSNAKKEHEMK